MIVKVVSKVTKPVPGPALEANVNLSLYFIPDLVLCDILNIIELVQITINTGVVLAWNAVVIVWTKTLVE